ncbi:hypothetical protein HYPSUDRAFT_188055 [Hypholoma sublateritium FD-334 SS-4]|uniref:Nephrocystin 3-like N-terminal domain-containing protein n=1 Tax=Hypholoma sublateritium (strain FD-334 SS-4) TaxID=945553 RepID=A0A0D2L2I8_HYPSF|nr:hypothetical protein HYPSUDRAFT_188055 [Hypholoma sublateritium FD-334 SS-4]
MLEEQCPDIIQHQHHGGEFFSDANHTTINGSNFINVSSVRAERNGFDRLLDHVATTAFHNSKQRVDPPRCHECTREAVLEELFAWIVQNIKRDTWITWLNGAAGAGKSAICQSIAETCIQRGVKVASFFFFRTDEMRNTIDRLVPTLAYQIIQLVPDTKELITQSIESHPLIFTQTFETQLDVLIVQPLLRLQLDIKNLSILLIIDGVDECSGESAQKDLIRTFAKLLRSKTLPLIVLFGSRRENQIQMAFNSRDMDDILKLVQLDYNYESEEDIRRFLHASFDEIRRTHPFNKRLADTWPSPDHIQEIATKSSGQFIYAAVVIKFVAAAKSNPATQLDIVRGLRPAGRATPFAELDALYMYIFSQVEEVQIVLELLKYIIIRGTYSLKSALYFFQLTEDDVEGIFAPLTSVVACDIENASWVAFHHASLPDFLHDKERSREYCISEVSTRLSVLWFKNAAAGRFMDLSKHHQYMDLSDFLFSSKASPNLRASITEYRPEQTSSAFEWNFFADQILRGVREIEFGDDGDTYRTLLKHVVQFVGEKHPDNLKFITVDISGILPENTDIAVEEENLPEGLGWGPIPSILKGRREIVCEDKPCREGEEGRPERCELVSSPPSPPKGSQRSKIKTWLRRL